MRNLCGTIFYIKTNVLQDFRICMSVPLKSTYALCIFYRMSVICSPKNFFFDSFQGNIFFSYSRKTSESL